MTRVCPSCVDPNLRGKMKRTTSLSVCLFYFDPNMYEALFYYLFSIS